MKQARGYFGIGIEHTKTQHNVGTLLRSAYIFGAAFVFTIGRRYKTQSSDTLATPRHVPLYHYADIADFTAHLPFDARLVGVELDDRAVPLEQVWHPERAVYLLGAEDHGLSRKALDMCHDLVRLPGEHSLNVAVAGSIVMHDRVIRGTRGMQKLCGTGGLR